ncbi:Chromate ion transporter [Aspergillus sp. HF37]|nr:Chromate ion transporter [Aspergillus sp. HF37]
MLLPAPLSHYIGSIRSLKGKWRSHADSRRNEGSEGNEGNGNPLARRMVDVFLRTWDLGFTAFGGPPVHFQILHGRFVEGKGGKEKWVDEQTYQELFAICQGLPGPGSTKMLFCLTLLHAGVIPAVLAFLIWSLPGAIGMYALSVGIQNIGRTLPNPAYALLSGLNAATVGIIAVSAVQLAEKAIRDKISRILVIFGACAGLCYNSLWYFPVLMVIGGFAIVAWDGWLSRQVLRAKLAWKNRHNRPVDSEEANTSSMAMESIHSTSGAETERNDTIRSRQTAPVRPLPPLPQSSGSPLIPPQSASGTGAETQMPNYAIRVRTGLVIMAVFFASFIAILVTRGELTTPPLALDLFASMYLAGTVIFGGGPVVIPLLRSYVVDPGWVSSRDFLIGLAIIQAFPGPNFNFAVFLGALTLHHSRFPTIFGAFLGGVGIFVPGITLAVAIQSFWSVLRKRKAVIYFLRGVNATAIGLVFTAVFRLWEIGYLTPENSAGQSLGKEPWWMVVSTLSYAGNAWFRVPPAVSIVGGAVLGLCWYGAVGR